MKRKNDYQFMLLDPIPDDQPWGLKDEKDCTHSSAIRYEKWGAKTVTEGPWFCPGCGKQFTEGERTYPAPYVMLTFKRDPLRAVRKAKKVAKRV